MSDTNADKPVWLIPIWLEDKYGIKINTQATMRSKRRITYYKRGGFIWYKESEIDAWIEEGKQV